MSKPWKILIVDDDEGIHSITRMVFRDYEFENRPIELVNALSGAQAQAILTEQTDIAVTIVDVVMETDHEGLNLVTFIRNQLANKDIRIILRTGHPGFAPETEVVIQYDINDYLSKAELSASRLLTSVVVALRSYRDIMSAKPQQEAVVLQQKTAPLHYPLQGLGAFFESKITPIVSASQKLTQFNHKPMVTDLVAEIATQCQQLSALNQLVIPLGKLSHTQVVLETQLDHLVSSYLPQAKQANWRVDYDIDPKLPKSIDVDLQWFSSLLYALVELAICRLDKTAGSQIMIELHAYDSAWPKLSIHILGKLNQHSTHEPWQEMLLDTVNHLASAYHGELESPSSSIPGPAESTFASNSKLVNFSFRL